MAKNKNTLMPMIPPKKSPRASKEGSGRFRSASLNPDKDTRDLLGQLMKDSDEGTITGAVVVAIHPRGQEQHYSVHISGRARTSPTYALGAVDACQMILRELSLKEAGIK